MGAFSRQWLSTPFQMANHVCGEFTAALDPLHILWAVPPSSEREEHLIPEFSGSVLTPGGHWRLWLALLGQAWENNDLLSCMALTVNAIGFQRRRKWES